MVDLSAAEVRLPSPLIELADDRLGSVRVLLKREDLIHPQLVGNKWRKLKYTLADARDSGADVLLTFGGAYSSHIRAVAAAGRIFGFSTIGVIRGQERPTNPGLERAAADGMRLHYLDRETYRRQREPDVLACLRREFGEFYLIPEGGSSPLALDGCAEAIHEIDRPFDLVTCPVGTGGTLAGLSAALSPGQRALGFAVLRGGDYLGSEVARLQLERFGHISRNWEISHAFHFGGFARRTSVLQDFVDDFAIRHGIELDWVYVAKMMFGLYRRIADGSVPPGSTVVSMITGGPAGPPAEVPAKSASTARTSR